MRALAQAAFPERPRPRLWAGAVGSGRAAGCLEVTATDLPGLAPAPTPQGHPASSPTAAPSYRRRPLSAALDAGHSCLVLEEGLRVPEDISIVGYDGIHLAKMVSPKLTTWQQNTEEIGRIAAEELIKRIEHPRTARPKQITVQGRLLEGETVRQID